MEENPTEEQLASAIYTVNRHAKTASENKYLYELKRKALEKLIRENRAKKVGLHYVQNPRFAQQQSSVLVQFANYYFHLLPKKEDFKALPHLGKLDEDYRNPKSRMSLSRAKKILSDFTGYYPHFFTTTSTRRTSIPKRKIQTKQPSSFINHYLD